jgi:hypothetical protein
LQWVDGEVSVSPYPSTSSAPDSRSNCSCTSAGSRAAPDTHTRRLDRSCRRACGPSASARNTVGTAGSIVGRQRSTAANSSSTSKRGSSTSVPASRTVAFRHTVMPYAWNNGSTPDRHLAPAVPPWSHNRFM